MCTVNFSSACWQILLVYSGLLEFINKPLADAFGVAGLNFSVAFTCKISEPLKIKIFGF